MKTVNKNEWDEWYYKVYGYFYKRISNKSDVEDLTSEVMNTAFMAQNVQNFSGYIWKVAHNFLVKYINTKNKEPMIVSVDNDEEFSQPEYVPEWYDEEAENQRSIQYEAKKNQILECISSHTQSGEKELIVLSVIEEKNSTQIAQIMEIKPATVRKKLSRALNKIREKCRDIWMKLITA